MPRPNIIFIMADDLGYGDLGCFGSQTIRTPHIDSLAANGLTFTDYHANGPVCTPTRAALLTGRYQQRCGLEGVIYVRGETRQSGLDPATQYCIAKSLQQTGYATAIYGKWHLGYRTDFNPVHHGFDQFRGYVSGNVDYHSHIDNAGIPDWWHNLHQVEENGYVTDLVSDYATHFIREHANQPFFLYVAHEAPHFPYQGRNDPADRTPGGQFPAHGSRSDKKVAYREMIEAMDDGVGRIMATLAELSLDEQTLVIFCSDNGAIRDIGSNGTLRGQKGDVFEGGHRVPAIACWRGQISPGTTTAETVLTMDWAPTFLALTENTLPRPHTLDGIDVSPLLLNPQQLPERTTYWRYSGRLAARRGDWKWIRDGDHTMLFNLAEDPGETTDLISHYPEIADTMANEASTWEQNVLSGVTLTTV